MRKKNFNRLKAMRFLTGKSQDELSFQMGISQSKISQIERGYRKPTPEEKVEIARILRRLPDEIFPEEE